MKPLIVISYATKRAGLLDIYERQLADAGIDFYLCPILPLTTWEQLSTIGFTIGMVREMLDRFKDYEHIVFTDAHDMLFFGTQEEVKGKLPAIGVLMAAEANLYPNIQLFRQICLHTPPTIWKFANGGIFGGNRDSLSEWADACEYLSRSHQDEINQAFYNRLMAQGMQPMKMDHDTELFFCMFGLSTLLKRDKDRPWNYVTNTYPNFIHFNGKTDPSGFLKEYSLTA